MRRIKRDTAVVVAATNELRAAILSGALEPGTRIRQEDLAHRLAVSRVPIRHALLVLEGEGLVRADRWRGASVAPLDPEMIRDLYQFRGAVEKYVAAFLAEQDFDPAPHRAVVVAGRHASSQRDVDRLIDLDLAFHTGLYDAMNNQILSQVMHGLWMHVRRLMVATLALTGHSTQIWEEHGAILDAIESHDSALAGTLAASHTVLATGRLLEHLRTHTDNVKPAPRKRK